jgi:hypothetical protein
MPLSVRKQGLAQQIDQVMQPLRHTLTAVIGPERLGQRFSAHRLPLAHDQTLEQLARAGTRPLLHRFAVAPQLEGAENAQLQRHGGINGHERLSVSHRVSC